MTSRAQRYVLPGILAGMAVAAALFFLLRGPWTILGSRKPAAEVGRLIAPLKPSDLNLLIVTLDTTRADHLGCYGYARIKTPRLDGLAADGILFQNATSQCPLTLPSHSSIFTGTYPFFHGVRDNGGFYLEEDQETLAEVVRRAGWATGAFIGAFVLDSRWGINQGFDYYYDNFDFAKYKKVSLDSVQREGGEVVKAFTEWFDREAPRKFFTWIHLYDPHTPYEPPEPFRTQYGGQPFGLYDGEIAYADSLVGRVLDYLGGKGQLERTIVVVLGDHGESLGEHQESAHGFFIYDATVSIPLIIKLPSAGLRGKRIDAQVQTVDLMPTLCEILGLPIPGAVQGQSLLPLIAGRGPKRERAAYSESRYPLYHYGWSDLKSLRTSRYKFIQAPRPELYDLTVDPGERVNLFDRNSSLAEEFARQLADLERTKTSKDGGGKAPRLLDEDTREKLMALGYIGGFTSPSRLDRAGAKGDPKDKIVLYNKIRMAEAASSAREYDDALAKLDEVIREDPGIMEARQVRATIYLRLDRPDEAVEECREALKIDPDYHAAVLTLARAYQKLQRHDDAVAGFKRALDLDPRDPQAHVSLGEVYLEAKDPDRAIACFEQALSIDPEHGSLARLDLGAALLEKGILDRAEQELLKALEMRPRIPDAHYNLGLLYEARGDIGRAIEEYRKEIEIHPAAYPAHFNLALLYGKTGRPREQVRELQEAIDSDPSFARAYLFLAKAYLDLNENTPEAIRLARKGIDLDPEAESAPLGHFVLADIYNRLGRSADYAAELEKGRALQRKIERSRKN